MSDKTIIILTIDFFIFIVLLKIVFGSFKQILKSFYYLIKPNILSIIQNDYENDFNYTDKFLFVAIIMFVLGIIEFAIFY